MSETLADGIIELDSPRGHRWSFTSERFGSGSYLWKDGSSILVSFIESKQRGNFRALVEQIHGDGLTVKVPTPLPAMERILRKNGYRQTTEHDPVLGPVEVWLLEPPTEGGRER